MDNRTAQDYDLPDTYLLEVGARNRNQDYHYFALKKLETDKLKLYVSVLTRRPISQHAN